jgi:hypothetical protein
MCNSQKTHIQLLALQDGTIADVLTHPRLGHVFAQQYSQLGHTVHLLQLNSEPFVSSQSQLHRFNNFIHTFVTL